MITSSPYSVQLKHGLLLLLAVFSICSPSAYAAQWYHVEVVVFEQLDAVSDEAAPEKMVPSASLTPESNTDLIQPAAVKTLVNDAARLKRTGSYRVLYHKAWQQPIQTKSQAKSVQLSNAAIHGRVRLHKGTYLYATVDIQQQQLTLTGLPYLQQAQRVRAKKTHYFDHPQLGVLLKLTPI